MSGDVDHVRVGMRKGGGEGGGVWIIPLWRPVEGGTRKEGEGGREGGRKLNGDAVSKRTTIRVEHYANCRNERVERF